MTRQNIILALGIILLSHVCLALAVYLGTYLSMNKRVSQVELNIQEIVRGFNQFVSASSPKK